MIYGVIPMYGSIGMTRDALVIQKLNWRSRQRPSIHLNESNRSVIVLSNFQYWIPRTTSVKGKPICGGRMAVKVATVLPDVARGTI